MLAQVGSDVFNDLEFFLSYTHEEKGTLLERFSEHTLGVGALSLLRERLSSPSTEVGVLRSYQSRVLHLRSCFDQKAEVREAHQSVRETQAYADWIRAQATEFEGVDGMEAAFFKFAFFRAIGLNSSPLLLNLLNAYNVVLSPAVALLSPVIYFLLPYCVLVRKFQLRFSFREFLQVLWRAMVVMVKQNRTIAGMQVTSMLISLFMYGQGVLNSAMLARDAWKVSALLYKQISGLFLYLRTGLRLLTLCEEPRVCARAREALESVPYDAHVLNLGARLQVFKEIREGAQKAARGLREFEGVLDKLLCDIGVGLISREWCLAEFDLGEKAVLRIEGLRHPAMREGVRNDLVLDERNCVLTGPNAAGKSTLIKAVGCNAVMAQSIGFADAKSYRCSPFSWINTQIHIPDCKGVESLFQAEMNRCRTNIDTITQLESHEHALLIFDEIFNNTNVVEGVSAAYAILERLGEHPNATTIITTHYPYLSKLPKYDRYKMNAVLDHRNRVREFPYVLSRGVSMQYIALEMLRDNFDVRIVDRAIEIKGGLLKDIIPTKK